FHESIHYFFITSVLIFLFMLITVRKTKPIDWLLAVFFTYLGASAIRNFPLFVFGTYIIFSKSASIILEKIITVISKQYSKIAINTGVSLLLFIAITVQSIHVITQHDIGFGAIAGASGGADFFLQHKLHGPIFNNFDIGSYLEY